MNIGEAYVICWLAIAVPIGICLIWAKMIGIRMNWLTMAMMPLGFVFLVAGMLSGNYLLVIPALLLFLGHVLTIRAIKVPRYRHLL